MQSTGIVIQCPSANAMLTPNKIRVACLYP